MILFWFRRDLRETDNAGFFHALSDAEAVLPAFVFDKNIIDKLPKNDARVGFIHTQLTKLDQIFRAQGSGMLVEKGNPLECIPSWCSAHGITAVYTNEDYEPYARKRDSEMEQKLASMGVGFKTFKDQVLFAPNEVLKKDGTAYKVYTPYSRIWITKMEDTGVPNCPSETRLRNLCKISIPEIPSLEQIGFSKGQHDIPIASDSQSMMDAYDETRNFPSMDSTSKLGVYLRFGVVSVRKIIKKARKSSQPTFLKELIWREFFKQVLWHYPHTVNLSFKPQYDRIAWRNNEEDFKKWCEGKTGYPLVDAGMRELNQTGFMHNRVRMLVGSFLCKHLLIDWRWGEAYFAEKLLDYEQASNVGNWQWVAGCGVDAAPYFRVFNPTEQVKKFDKDHKYIQKWVPEYQSLTYPNQMIEHKMARERCLETYKAGLAS
jgi:deoxyribodipyrimidine photo-lyase